MTDQETKIAVFTQPIPDVASIDASVPKPLAAMCRKATALDPADRYATCHDLLDDIQNWLDDLPVTVQTETIATQSSRWLRKNRSFATALMAIIALLSVSLVAIGLLYFRAEHLRRVTDRALIVAEQHQQNAEQSEAETLRMLYASDMRQASDKWNAGDLLQMKSFLDNVRRYDADGTLRDVEWYFLQQKCTDSSRLLHESPDKVYALAHSRDGRQLLSAGLDSVLRFHDSQSGKVIDEIATNQKEINHIAISHAGDTIATAGDDGTVKLWDFDTHEMIRELTIGKGRVVWNVTFTHDDARLITTGGPDRTFAVFQADGTCIGNLDTGGSARWSVHHFFPFPDGSLLTCQKELRLWVPNVESYEVERARTFDAGVNHIKDAVVDENRRLIILARNTSVEGLVIHSLDDFSVLATLSLPEFPKLIELFPTRGLWVVGTLSGVYRTYQIDHTDGRFRGTRQLDSWLIGHLPANTVPSPDEQDLLFTAGNQIRRIRIKDETSEENIQPYQIVASPYSNPYVKLDDESALGKRLDEIDALNVALSAGGTRLAVLTKQGHVTVFDTESGSVVLTTQVLNRKSDRITFSPDGDYLATRWHSYFHDLGAAESTDAVSVVELKTNTVATTGDTNESHGAVFDHSGRIIYMKTRNALVCRDVATMELVWTIPADVSTRSFITSHPTKNHVVIGDKLRNLVVRDTETGDVVRRIPLPRMALNLAWSPQGTRAFVRTVGNKIVIVDIDRGSVLLEFESPAECETTVAAAVIDNGTKLALPRNDETVIVDLPQPSEFALP